VVVARAATALDESVVPTIYDILNDAPVVAFCHVRLAVDPRVVTAKLVGAVRVTSPATVADVEGIPPDVENTVNE